MKNQENQRRGISISCFKPRRAIFSMLVACFILSISLVSAFEFDNVKSYDLITREVTITNAFGYGDEIGKARLNTPLNVKVSAGYQKVGEFDLWVYEDYSNVLKPIKIKNMKTNKEEIREIDYKYLSYEEVLIDDYKTECSDVFNEINNSYSKECENVLTGSHYETKEVWNKITPADLKKNDVLTVGIFTEVKIGDYIDWIPTIFGVEVEEWATWEEDLEVGLVSYYKLDESSGAVLDVHGSNDGTNNGATPNVMGKINTAYDFTPNEYISLGDGLNPNLNSITISAWFKTSATEGQIIGNTESGATNDFALVVISSKLSLLRQLSTGGSFNADSLANVNDNAWHFALGISNSTGAYLYLDGSLVDSVSFSPPSGAGGLWAVGRRGRNVAESPFNGNIDEVGIWSRALTLDEVTFLYNNNYGLTYGNDELFYIILNSPENNHISNTSKVTFNCSVEVIIGATPTNMTLYTNETGSWEAKNLTTGLSGASSTQIWNRTFNHNDNILWSCQACDSNGDCEFAGENRTLFIDLEKPLINITSPIATYNYFALGNNETLNWTVSDTNLDTCWYEYNGTNQTVTCGDNTTTFILVEGIYNLTFYADDTAGNENSSFVEWSYKILGNNRTHNTSSYETARETFSINVSANSSLTAVTLDYNGTDYSATQSGNIWSKTIDIPIGVQNNSFKWKFTYAGDTIYSNTYYQNVEETIFTLCNASYTDDFLNITFKDESDANAMNASIPTSTFEYYLGSGTVTKTYNFINNTDNNNYLFCATPDRTMHVNPYVQYKRNSDYPQRIWDAAVQDYTSTLSTQVLYLLESADGIYVTLQIINSANQLISGVDITATREIESIDTIVAFGTTGDSGTVTFWLNPDFSHTFDLTKSGYTDYSTSFIPTQSSYTITMGEGIEIENSTIQGITKSILPTNSYLENDTSYTFGFTLDSSYWDVSDYGFDLRLANGTIITGDNTGVEGTALTKIYNVNNQSIIYLDYYWVINDVYTNSTVYWIIQNTENTQWSIAVFFTDLNTYIDSGIYGLDNFGKNLIIFLILFISVGIMSYKYGATSPLAISSLIFGIIFFFDVVAGLIPTIRGIDYLLTYLSALILTLSIFNEVRV